MFLFTAGFGYYCQLFSCFPAVDLKWFISDSLDMVFRLNSENVPIIASPFVMNSLQLI